MNKNLIILISTLAILNTLHCMQSPAPQEPQATTIIDALNSIVPHYNPTLSVMTYNVDNAVTEEKYESTQWRNRASRVVNLINEAQADIVCLQELRDLTQTPGTPTVDEFLANLKNYRHRTGERVPSGLAFGQATLYNPKKLFATDTITRWLSDTPEEPSDTWTAKRDTAWGFIVLCTKFYTIHQDKVVKNCPPFWVFNTHFGIDEEIKTKSCHKLLEIIKTVAQGNPYIICGDFNFFPDKDAGKQRAILSSVIKDLGCNAKTLAGNNIEGTFVGYEHDKFKADLKNMISRLDHIFGSVTVEKVGNSTLYTCDYPCMRKYPSDHLPLMAQVKLYSNKSAL